MLALVLAFTLALVVSLQHVAIIGTLIGNVNAFLTLIDNCVVIVISTLHLVVCV